MDRPLKLNKKKVKNMAVWVLKGNPNYKFYEILGGKYLGQKMLEIDSKNYSELAYGWTDITKILKLELSIKNCFHKSFDSLFRLNERNLSS
jgi:hypothetical protein